MPRFTVRSPSGATVSYDVDKDVITIGRTPENDIRLYEISVSRCHAEIRRKENSWLVADRGSCNGTLLKGKLLVKPKILSSGDEIVLGEMVVVFEDPAVVESARSPERPTEPLAFRTKSSDSGAQDPVFVGSSAAIRKILALVEKIAPSNATVLITGENGTGKELMARRIHLRSRFSQGPFVVINCPALPGSLLESELFGIEKGVATGVEPRAGRLEGASGGTLFFDEVGDMDLSAQARILRFLEEKKVERVGGRRSVALNVRIMAATNHDLRADIERGLFRRDLYHRFNTVGVKLPALRERRDDIPLLIGHFLERRGKPSFEVSPEALDLLMRYEFPGNVRELERIVERAVLLSRGPVLAARDLPDEVCEGSYPAVEETTLSMDLAAVLYERIVSGKESFWDVVHKPFLERRLSREVVSRLIARGHKATGSYRKMAGLFHMTGDHKRLLNFIYFHGLQVKR